MDKNNFIININFSHLSITLDKVYLEGIKSWFSEKKLFIFLCFISALLSGFSWIYFSSRGLHLTYNDAMSHLDIARRVIDNIKPGAAQIGSVWLPLFHLLMLPTIWIDSFWHSGFSGAIISMGSFILATLFTYKTIRLLGGGLFASLFGAFVVVSNTNFLYLQTTALTEPLLMANYSLGSYYLLLWAKTKKPIHLVVTAFFVLLASLTRYDGWLFFLLALGAIFIATLVKDGWKKAEGQSILFGTLAGLGIVLWLGWNLLIFGDPLYFAFSEYSAKVQQDRMLAEGLLLTKGNFLFSIKTYFFSMIDNIGIYVFIFALIGWIYFFIKNKTIHVRAIAIVFLSPIFFNILALYLGHSVIFLPETMGNSWFNVRYGLVVLPMAGVFIGYLLGNKNLLIRVLVPTVILLQIGLFFTSRYAITLTDGLVGASQKNVTLIGSEINQYAGKDNGLILASVASHDAILFSSGLPLRRFIHEGTGKLWKDSLQYPDQYAQYIIMRTGDGSDSVSRAMMKLESFQTKYKMVYKGDFANFYERTSFPLQQ